MAPRLSFSISTLLFFILLCLQTTTLVAAQRGRTHPELPAERPGPPAANRPVPEAGQGSNLEGTANGGRQQPFLKDGKATINSFLLKV